VVTVLWLYAAGFFGLLWLYAAGFFALTLCAIRDDFQSIAQQFLFLFCLFVLQIKSNYWFNVQTFICEDDSDIYNGSSLKSIIEDCSSGP